MYWHSLLHYYILYANEIHTISGKFKIAEVVYSRTTQSGPLPRGLRTFYDTYFKCYVLPILILDILIPILVLDVFSTGIFRKIFILWSDFIRIHFHVLFKIIYVHRILY